MLSTCGWTVPYLASNVVGGDCGAVVILKKNLKAPRPSEHPPVKNVNLSHITRDVHYWLKVMLSK